MHRTAVIVGAGQAGLAMSRCLDRRGIDHVVLERGRIAESWQSERWDSIRLLTPNWMTRLPDYARSFDAPVQAEAGGATIASPSALGWLRPTLPPVRRRDGLRLLERRFHGGHDALPMRLEPGSSSGWAQMPRSRCGRDRTAATTEDLHNSCRCCPSLDAPYGGRSAS